MAMALMSRFRNTCLNLVSGSNTDSGLHADDDMLTRAAEVFTDTRDIRTQPPDANRPHTRQLSTFILRYQPKVASEKMSTSRGRM